MPDQSLSNEPVSGKTDQEATNPADTSANSPRQATPESLESNVNRASEGEKLQADVTINQDPIVGSGDVQEAGNSGGSDEYDDEEKYPYRELQQLAKNRKLDASGKRDEIVARLREADGGGSTGGDSSDNLSGPTITQGPSETDVPRASVDPSAVENGGITKTGKGQAHAELLQGLSAERKQQQLSAISARSERSEA